MVCWRNQSPSLWFFRVTLGIADHAAHQYFICLSHTVRDLYDSYEIHAAGHPGHKCNALNLSTDATIHRHSDAYLDMVDIQVVWMRIHTTSYIFPQNMVTFWIHYQRLSLFVEGGRAAPTYKLQFDSSRTAWPTLAGLRQI